MEKNISDEQYAALGIDKSLTFHILDRVNSSSEFQISSAYTFPDREDHALHILDEDYSLQITPEQLHSFSDRCNQIEALQKILKEYIGKNTPILLHRNILRKIGLALMQKLAYGVLNGGLATSYVDSIKNSAYLPPLYSIVQDKFPILASGQSGKAKALTPAYVNPDGSSGYSFAEMKMRAVLILMLESWTTTGIKPRIPLIEMRNHNTERQLSQAYPEFKDSPILIELINYIEHDIIDIRYCVQPFIAAYTHSCHSNNGERHIFTTAYGHKDKLLALPGGHGQNFQVLQEIYSDLHKEGYTYCYLVNIDNLGNTPDPIALAVTALLGADASFEFTPKTRIDRKGGVLVRNNQNNLACVDIGPAISSNEIAAAEKDGKEILFNCATGLFSLEYLTRNIDTIISSLPIRVTDQNKDAGLYAQAEQITWEIIEQIPEPIVFSVKKSSRFLAAKLLSEMVLTSQADSIMPLLKDGIENYDMMKEQITDLQSGLHNLLKTHYGMKLIKGRWVPKSVRELIQDFG